MSITEDLGIAFVQNVVARMGFFFREQSKHDFGVDAHIETQDSERKGSGRNIAVQIKSGSSYIQRNANGDIVFYTDERHIRYWAEHSLPVILVIYDPESEKAWWSDVKAYISRHPLLLSQAPYKIILPDNQQFSVEIKDTLVELASTPQALLTLTKQHFSLISLHDISSGDAKRYKAKITVGNVSNDIIRLAIYQAVEHLKIVVEHGSDLLSDYWKDQRPHLIRLFVYRDWDDNIRVNPIAHAIWRDTNWEPAKIMWFDKANDSTEDIEIRFVDTHEYEAWRQFTYDRIITKHQFTKKVEKYIFIADQLVSQAKTLTQQRDSEHITAEVYINEMSKLAQKYTEQIEHKYDEGTTAPSDVRDAENCFVETMYRGSDIFITFTELGLTKWTDQKQRDYILKSSFKRYLECRNMLEFEMKKIR